MTSIFDPTPITILTLSEDGQPITLVVPVKFSPVTDERQAELHEAFNLVADPENWKNPIDAEIDPRQVADVVEAIHFFTGSIAVVEIIQDTTREAVRVTAEGYYLTIGA